MTDRERVDPSEKAFHPLAKRNLGSGLYKCKLIICPTCRATVQPPPGAPVVACGVCGATMHVAPAFPPPPPVVLKSRPSGSCFWMPCLIAFAWVSDAGETLARGVGALFCCCLGLDMLE